METETERDMDSKKLEKDAYWERDRGKQKWKRLIEIDRKKDSKQKDKDRKKTKSKAWERDNNKQKREKKMSDKNMWTKVIMLYEGI